MFADRSKVELAASPDILRPELVRMASKWWLLILLLSLSFLCHLDSNGD